MREQLLNDEQRRDDAHGAVELGPPAQTDQGGSPYQTAFDPGAGNPQGGPPTVVYGGKPPGWGAGAEAEKALGGEPDLLGAMKQVSGSRLGGSDAWQLFGRAYGELPQ